MLSPKKVKWRKQHRPPCGVKKTTRCVNIDFGDYALQAISGGRLTARQLEAGRVAIARSVRRGGKLWIRVFPNWSITKKAAETRMGSGKGNPEYWAAHIKPGKILFEINGVTRNQAKKAFNSAGHKFPFKTHFLARSS